ncbi:MAG: 4-coumarate--CoA ligase family protein [Chloroflexi bacterium]|jgi:acyl-CoA synthetase (AMP-forming)/AMP-acid ligase II|nr:4-coumarate--CoA ligase family protein [Chloroflexota bacterium]
MQEATNVAPGRVHSQFEFVRPPINYPVHPYDELLTQSAQRFPENTALVFKDISLTYRELEALTNSFANALLGLGIKQGDRVCILMTNRPEFIISWFAVARIGATISPMNPSYKEREVAYQLSNSEAVGVVVQNELLPLVQSALSDAPNLKHIITAGPGRPANPGASHSFAELVKNHPPTAPARPEIGWDDLLALPYSSGTTGLPKGVMLSHKNLVSNAYQMTACSRITFNDRLMLFLPFYHIYGTMLMGSGILSGGISILMERFEPVECMRLIQKYKVSLFYSVPPVLVMLTNWPLLKQQDLSSIRHVMSGAAPLAPEVARRFQETTGVLVLQGYGLTEASPLTHINPVYDERLVKLETVGLPIHDTEQKIVDIETGEKELAVGEVGELIVRGPQVMQGYWKAPEATAATLRNGWLYTGDIAALDEEGYVIISDRKKEMIKYKGFGIAPAELEALLFEHPAVADAAVIPKADEEAGEVPKAYVVLKAGNEQVTPQELVQWANGKLAGYKNLKEVEFIDAIPKNPSGKILRRILKEREREKSGQA